MQSLATNLKKLLKINFGWQVGLSTKKEVGDYSFFNFCEKIYKIFILK